MINNQLILNDLKNILNSSFPNLIEKIILFGSQINGDFQEYSDFDILIIFKMLYLPD